MIAQRKKLISQWVDKAENDLRAATIILREESPPTDTVCFHSQQAAEKYLKAYLIKIEEPLRRVHDLVFLVNLCAKNDGVFSDLREIASKLNRYYIETRYPADFPTSYSTEEAEKAVDHAHTICDFVRKRIS